MRSMAGWILVCGTACAPSVRMQVLEPATVSVSQDIEVIAVVDAITSVDQASGGYALSFGINCAHPDHFSSTLEEGGEWTARIGLIRANASRMSHEELDNAEELDAGDRTELGGLYADLRALLPGLQVMGGCCGTDSGHIAEIGKACFGPVPATAV